MSGPEVLGAGHPRLRPSADLADARAQVAGAAPGAATHEEARRRILAFLHQHPGALHRSCAPGHLTGSALVADPDERLLLLHHAKLGRWLQPGGHADGDANLAGVALREATEETGLGGLRVVLPAIDCDVHEVRPPREAPHLHLDVRFLVLAPAGAVPAPNHESRGARWVGEGDLAAVGADEGLQRLVAAGLALARSLPPSAWPAPGAGG